MPRAVSPLCATCFAPPDACLDRFDGLLRTRSDVRGKLAREDITMVIRVVLISFHIVGGPRVIAG